ncbi:MAG: sigma 54-interacting transcriptional regulator [Pyrinomonadaceae bacterium]
MPNTPRANETEILLSVGAAIAETREKGDLLNVVNSKLKELIDFTHSAIGVTNPDGKSFRLFLLDPASRSADHPDYKTVVTRPSFPFHDGVYDTSLDADAGVVLDLDELNERIVLPPYLRINYERGIKESLMIALRKDGKGIGVLGLFAEKKGTFIESNLRIIRGISSQLSVAVANIISSDATEQSRKEMASLLSISTDIASIRDKKDLLHVIQGKLKRLFTFNDAAVVLFSENKSTYRVFLSDCEGPRADHPDFAEILDFDYPSNDGIHDSALNSPTAVAIKIAGLDLTLPNLKFIYDTGLREIAAVALRDADEVFGVMTLLSETENAFSESDLRLLLGISNQVSTAIANVLANEKIASQIEEIERYKQQLEAENLGLQKEISVASNHEEIIGSSEEMQRVFRLISQVADSDSTVLILGETGTGKELIARAIHRSSPRNDRLLVKVNCASLPPTLVESELFGHERGSFTGAVDRRIGKFELANHGTLFLDEIGELSLELQAKLLRAIQEKEIERVGGKSTLKVNVRIVAATNRNLIEEVEQKRFRADLFYRLNVFPISLPPLRDRTEDIAPLAAHFSAKFSRKSGRRVFGIADQVLSELTQYEWPGNVRELEHLIERGVLLANGPMITEIHLPDLKSPPVSRPAEPTVAKTLTENESEHILEVLRKCAGKVSGPDGAAAALGVPPSTLNSKMKKLGITKRLIFDKQI